VIYGGGYNLLDLALARNALVDLTDTINSDAEWKSLFSASALDTNSRNGRIYASSNEGSLIGYFYNKELFAKAGISAPATTWDDFFAQCAKLKAAGITPLSMDTADSAWVTTLWMGAYIATENAAGLNFVRQMNPRNYSTPEVIKAAERIQYMLQNYTTLDAVGGAYEHAANNFLSGKTAMIANGPWMVGDFSDTSKTSAGFVDKVGSAIYPGSFVFDAPIQGFLVTKQKDAAQQKAAIAMVKFFTGAHAQAVALDVAGMIPSSPTVTVSASAKAKWPLLIEFMDQANTARYRSDNLQATMYANLLDVISQELPRLASGDISPEQFCKIMTDNAAKN
jgi:raffinose/stachyose/melibiose transport system substrate-binding protein